MNNQVKHIVLPETIQSILSDILGKCRIDHLLEEDFWIAGGFPRVIHLCLNRSEQEAYNILKEYFRHYADIDIFTTSKKKSLQAAESVNEDFMKEFYTRSYYHEGPFATNVQLNTSTFSKMPPFVYMQFITEFVYSGIEETFDNFDFSNVKFAINKRDNKYLLYYTEMSEYYNRANVLNLEKIVSPFLASRIRKYTERYGLEFNNDKNNRLLISEYIHKLFSGCWSDAFKNCKFDSELFVKSTNSLVGLDDLDLCLFLGKFEHSIFTKTNSEYGVYTMAKVTDWAAHEINKRHERQQS